MDTEQFISEMKQALNDKTLWDDFHSLGDGYGCIEEAQRMLRAKIIEFNGDSEDQVSEIMEWLVLLATMCLWTGVEAPELKRG